MIGDGSASPWRDIGDATRCECSHRFDAHSTSAPYPCEASLVVYGGEHEPCACEGFLPAEMEP